MYELSSEDPNDMQYKIKEKFHRKTDCFLLILCSNHLILCLVSHCHIFHLSCDIFIFRIATVFFLTLIKVFSTAQVNSTSSVCVCWLSVYVQFGWRREMVGEEKGGEGKVWGRENVKEGRVMERMGGGKNG